MIGLEGGDQDLLPLDHPFEERLERVLEVLDALRLEPDELVLHEPRDGLVLGASLLRTTLGLVRRDGKIGQ